MDNGSSTNTKGVGCGDWAVVLGYVERSCYIGTRTKYEHRVMSRFDRRLTLSGGGRCGGAAACQFG